MNRIFEQASATPSKPNYEKRHCWCGTKLSIWNKGTTCFVHDEEDIWDEYTKLADEYRWGTKKDLTDWIPQVLPPYPGENCASYAKRLFSTEESVPVSSLCFHYGYSNSEVRSAIANAKKFFRRRGWDVEQAGEYGGGYKLVPMLVV